MFSAIPPVGTPLSWRYLFSPGENADKFKSRIEKLLTGKCYLTSSGKSALYLILKSSAEIYPGKDEVIIPDYTCWTVPSAVIRAGMKLKTIDIQPGNFGIDPQQLEENISGKTLTVIAAHLFGIPGDIEAIEKICRERGVILIDDAAQALGAKVGGRQIGSFGDASALSFGRGKNITTLSGGAAVIRNNELRDVANGIYSREFSNPLTGALKDTIQLAAYKILFNRHLYWIPDTMPFLELGKTEFNPRFDIHKLPENRASRGAMMIGNLERITGHRVETGRKYRERLSGIGQIELPEPELNSQPVYLRYPVILKDEKRRRYILEKGHSLGISAMYPGKVSSIDGISPYLSGNDISNPNAEYIARGLVTLPTHFQINDVDVRRISDFITDAVR
ncbi:MAG: aminotransferase class V-fold PLP-dependent enzyme [candidate division Zixibacteria bacterium]|nr:aminotransferase class V-fold PLP-dependent enzyme [candidate division Zixibacteria bacterium]